jgi:isopentenyl-diphosphate delta-isomerase
MEKENVILVDEQDIEIGTLEKIEAHQKALLHRAFSVFVFNTKGQILLQRRYEHKYHSGGLWTNTCCGHPRPGEYTKSAAERRLNEEMGFRIELNKEFDFIYQTKFGNGLTEHELDHVFYGKFNDAPKPNPQEVSDWKYVDWNALTDDIKNNPDQYTVWFKICVDRINEIKKSKV